MMVRFVYQLAWIWESSLWQSRSNRAPSVHLQYRSRPKSERVVADSSRSSTQCSTNLPDFDLAPSGERHKLGRTSTGPSWVHAPWESSGEVASLGRAAFLFYASCQRGAKFLNFDRGPIGPRTRVKVTLRICQYSLSPGLLFLLFLNVTEALRMGNWYLLFQINRLHWMTRRDIWCLHKKEKKKKHWMHQDCKLHQRKKTL